MSRTIAVVGLGSMGRSALAILAAEDPGLRFTLIDRDETTLSAVRASLSAARVNESHRLDVNTDPLPLRGIDLVLNFAGPFFSGSDKVARAALQAKAAYIDVGDDVEATRAILALDSEAKNAGIPLITGAGLSPGISNWLAVQLLVAHPHCDEIKIVWVTHEPDPGGLAPLRHMLHMAVTPCPVWRDGRIVETPGFVTSTAEYFDFPPPFARIQALDTSHPEPLTLSRRYPHLRAIGCKGALRPDWANAAFSTLGRIGFGDAGERVTYGDLSIEPAEFLWRMMWQRYKHRPARDRSVATGVMIMALREGALIEARTVIDDGDMSRGTGLGAAAAALTLLEEDAQPGAAGVEAIPADRGIARFLHLARTRGWFTRGVITTQ